VEILSLNTESFRNLASHRIEFHPRLNLVVGDNGHGKTNLLEALALVTGRPSFRATDLAIVHQDAASRTVLSSRVRATDPTDGAAPGEQTWGVVLGEGSREHYCDGRRVSRMTVRQALPAVFLTSHDLSRLSGPPSERRRALDRAALAHDPEHGRTLRAYEKARLSKTRLLALKNRFDADEMAVYETALCEAGARVAAGRRTARAFLAGELARRAANLGSPFSGLTLGLVSDLPAEGDVASHAAALAAAMHSRKAEERRAGRCLVGPHRDDVVLKSEGLPVASRASSGETRTFILAWTLAEMALLEAGAGTAPVLGFDDFDSEWDPRVLAAFAEALPEEGQVFLTSARPDAVRGLPLPSGVLHRMTAGCLHREGILGAGRGERARAGRS
jgi:DNA replication and repair protein RecF